MVRNIQERGRDYERSIRIDYLQELNERYDQWIETYDLGKRLVIDVNKLNLKEPKDLSIIISKIDAQLHGLFTE